MQILAVLWAVDAVHAPERFLRSVAEKVPFLYLMLELRHVRDSVYRVW